MMGGLLTGCTMCYDGRSLDGLYNVLMGVS